MRRDLCLVLTCEQLAILLIGSPTLGHHATSLTQSLWPSNFSSRVQLLSLSSLQWKEQRQVGVQREGGGGGGGGRGAGQKLKLSHLHILRRLSPPPVTSRFTVLIAVRDPPYTCHTTNTLNIATLAQDGILCCPKYHMYVYVFFNP